MKLCPVYDLFTAVCPHCLERRDADEEERRTEPLHRELSIARNPANPCSMTWRRSAGIIPVGLAVTEHPAGKYAGELAAEVMGPFSQHVICFLLRFYGGLIQNPDDCRCGYGPSGAVCSACSDVDYEFSLVCV